MHGRGHELIWKVSAVDSRFCIIMVSRLAYFNAKVIPLSNFPCTQYISLL